MKNPTGRKVFSPSYEAESKEEYLQKVAEGPKRDLHVMVESGRVRARYGEESPAHDPPARRPPAQISDPTVARLEDQGPPWPARTQALDAWVGAASRKGLGRRNEEQSIRLAIEKLTQPLGFLVPDTSWPLVEAGMPPRAAQILVGRAGGHLYPSVPTARSKELIRSSLRDDLVKALRRPLVELEEPGSPAGLLEVRGDGRLVLPLPGRRARDAEVRGLHLLGPTGQQEQVFGAAEIATAYQAHRERTKAKNRRDYYPREDDPAFLDSIYRTLEGLIRTTAVRWRAPNLRLVLTFSYRGKQFARQVFIREHSKSVRGTAPRPPLEYKSLRNVDLVELPGLLARLAGRKKRKGRQLPPVSRTNPMSDQDQLKAMLQDTGASVPVPGKPGRVYVYSKRQDAVVETTAKRARSWRAIGAAGRAASQQLSQAAREAQENPMGRNRYDDDYWTEQYSRSPYGAQAAVPTARRNPQEVLFTTKGQPYIIKPDGKARFISKDQARSLGGYKNPGRPVLLNPSAHGRALGGRAATENRRKPRAKTKRSNPYAKAVFAQAKAIFAQTGCDWSSALRAAHAHVKASGGQRAAANPWFRSSHVPDLYLPDTTATRSALVPSPFGPDGDLTYVRSTLEQGPYAWNNPHLPPGVYRRGPDRLPPGVHRHGHFFPHGENVTGLVGPEVGWDEEMFDRSGTDPGSVWGGGQRARGAFAYRQGQYSPTGTSGFQPVNRRNPRKPRKAKKNKKR